jgi:cysteine sulfinate desulfinase/cysteine desulfurase-like protein
LEKLLEKLKEYLHMETEIPFEEFSEYYRNLISELNQTFNDLDKDARVKALYICSIVQSNGDARAKASKVNAKVFKKMSAKCAFWVDAIKFNLGKDGMTAEEIERATEEINASI